MSDKGFVKLDRKMLSWGWKNDYKMVALWIEILLQANIGNREHKGEIFERGTFPTSLKQLSENTGLSIQNVRTCLNRLKSTHEITIISTNKGMKIIVEKWDEYQGGKTTPNKQNNKQSNISLTRNQHATNTQLTTLKERKNEIKKEYDVVKIKSLRERWVEGGYDEQLVDTALNVCKQNLTEQNMQKVMNILTNSEIVNPIGYIQTLKQKGAL